MKGELAESSSLLMDHILRLSTDLKDIRENVKTVTVITEASTVSSTYYRKLKEEDVDDIFEDFSLIFDKHVLQYAAKRCAVVRTVIMNDSLFDMMFLDRVALSLHSMMFSKVPKDCRSVFPKKAGSQYCLLRRAIVKTSIVNVSKDTFLRFSDCGECMNKSAPALGKKVLT